MHSLNFEGNYFSVEGPLNLSRSKQGRPVVFQAGTSSAFMDIAAKHAEVIMAPGDNFAYLKGYTAELKRRVSNQGRSPNNLLIMPSHSPIVGEMEKEALEKLREIESLMPIGHRFPMPKLMESAENVAEKIEYWYREGVMDVLLIRQDYPAGFEDFIKLVVPILQEKGIFKKEYETNTLRGNLELPYPENMYKK